MQEMVWYSMSDVCMYMSAMTGLAYNWVDRKWAMKPVGEFTSSRLKSD